MSIYGPIFITTVAMCPWPPSSSSRFEDHKSVEFLTMMFFFQKIVAITSPEDSYLFRQMFLFSFEMLFLISALATFSVTRLDYF